MSKYVGWQFVQQEILFNDKPLREAFRSSSNAVRGHWWIPYVAIGRTLLYFDLLVRREKAATEPARRRRWWSRLRPRTA